MPLTRDTAFVPADWTGSITTCTTCGNDAPAIPRTVSGDDGRRECTSCFVGRVLNGVCTDREARALRTELTAEIRRPSSPWGHRS